MKKIILLISFFLIYIVAFAQEELSLADAIQKTLDNNYDIQVSQKEAKIAEIQNSWGETGILPSIEFSASIPNYAYSDMHQDTLDIVNKNTRLSGGVRLNWVLFDGFAMFIQKSKLENLESLAQGNLTLLVENTLEQTIATYYNALLQQEKLKVMKYVVDLSEERYRYSLEKEQIGTINSYDVLQAKTAYLSDRSDYLLQRLQYRTALRNLSYLLSEADKLYVLTTDFDVVSKDYNLRELMEKMLSSNKTLLNQYTNIKIAEDDRRLANSALYYPTLSVSSGYSMGKTTTEVESSNPLLENFYSASQGSSTNYDVILTLSYNIYNAGRDWRRKQIAKIQQDVEQTKLEQVEHDLTNSLLLRFEEYNQRKKVHELSLEREQAASLNLQRSEERFKQGAINSFNYRDIQVEYLNSSTSKLESIYNLLVSDTQILRIVGSIITDNSDESVVE